MIQANGLTKRYGAVLAVDDVSFEVPRGSITGFLGPNGAGKTTTIRMIAGYVPPDAGTVTVAGFDVQRQWREARARVGYLPESAPIYPEMRVQEFLEFRARLHGMPRRDRREAIDRSIARCGLAHVRRRLVGQLSKGYRQRTGLAAALLHSPALLILDEPTVGLDPSQVLEFRSLLRDLAGQCTVLISSHILSEVEAICDRILMMSGGRLIASGDMAHFRSLGAGAARYVVELRGETSLQHGVGDGLGERLLEGLPGVTAVEVSRLDERWSRITVVAAAGAADLREAIAERAAGRQALVRELRRDEETLEHLFVRLAAGSKQDDRSAAGRRDAGSGVSAA